MSTDQSQLDLLGALITQTSRLATALEAIASVIAPAPNLVRPMSDWPKVNEILEAMGAYVTRRDKDGPTQVEYAGRIYTRHSAAPDEEDDKDGAIWFNCVVSGNVKDGNLKWARLLTFRDRKTDKLPAGAKKLKVTPISATSPTPAPAMPAATPAPTMASTAKTGEPAATNQPTGLDAHFGPRQRPPAPTLDASAARAKSYALSGEAIKRGKLSHQDINALVKSANGGGFAASLAALEEKLAN